MLHLRLASVIVRPGKVMFKDERSGFFSNWNHSGSCVEMVGNARSWSAFPCLEGVQQLGAMDGKEGPDGQGKDLGWCERRD